VRPTRPQKLRDIRCDGTTSVASHASSTVMARGPPHSAPRAPGYSGRPRPMSLMDGRRPGGAGCSNGKGRPKAARWCGVGAGLREARPDADDSQRRPRPSGGSWHLAGVQLGGGGVGGQRRKLGEHRPQSFGALDGGPLVGRGLARVAELPRSKAGLGGRRVAGGRLCAGLEAPAVVAGADASPRLGPPSGKCCASVTSTRIFAAR
jgi:hypothetical protein